MEDIRNKQIQKDNDPAPGWLEYLGKIINSYRTGNVVGNDKTVGVKSALKSLRNQSLGEQSVLGAETTPTMTPRPSPTLAPDANEFEKLALPILNKYEIPPAVAFGMREAEGGNIGSHNVYNLGAFDSNPQNAYDYDSPEAGVEAFARLIAENPRFKEAYAKRSEPEAMVEAIMQAGYAGDPKTWKRRSIDQARRAGGRGAGEIYDSYSQFVKDTPGFRRYR